MTKSRPWGPDIWGGDIYGDVLADREFPGSVEPSEHAEGLSPPPKI